MTVYKNLAFGPKVRKEPRDTLRQRIHDVADLLEIRHLLDRAPAALSGGSVSASRSVAPSSVNRKSS